jgi:uncharacterized protein DUF5317
VFILWAVFIGLAIGVLSGGRVAALSALQLRWSWVMLAGLLLQVILFSDVVAARVGAEGPVLYVCSTAAVAAAVLANWRLTGMPLVALGAACNLAAIVANGGYMPASPGALAALGRHAPTIYSNSAVPAAPALAPLGDVFALPAWVPWANIFSIGDVLIAVGVAWVIVAAMHRRPVDPPVVAAPPLGDPTPVADPGAPAH